MQYKNTYEEVAANQVPASHREFFRCRTCKHQWVFEYFPYQNMFGSLWRVTPIGVYTPENDAAHCPTCHSRKVQHGTVQGKVSRKACGVECMEATGGQCCCSCGGANHGKHAVKIV